MSGPRSTTPKQEDATRRRLLEAAAGVFAEQGYRAATVRQICARARANVAAVSYHFGDKEALYAEALRHALHCAHEKYPFDHGLAPGAPAEEQLQAFVHSFLLRIFDQGPHSWHGKLMAREMIEPTAALDRLVREAIRPMSERLELVVKTLLGPEVTPGQVRRCSLSIVGQCLFYHHCRPLYRRLHPEEFGPSAVEELAHHITQFSMAALASLRKQSMAIMKQTR